MGTKASAQIWGYGSWQSAHASLNKIHPPSKDKKIFQILSFVNIMVIPEHHSMADSRMSQYEIVFSGFSFLNCCFLHDSHQKQWNLWCVDLLEERFFRPCGNHGFSPFFLLNALTQLQCIEILSGAWLLWLALLCQSSHSHRHFKSVCGAASLRANSCVPSPSLCQQEQALWPYRGQEPDSGWNLTQLVAATLRVGKGELRSSSSVLVSAALIPSCW